MPLTVIIPVLNEATGIAATLQCLQPMRSRAVEVIVVDGGSEDDTVSRATPLADRIILSACGRAVQMNAGASQATGDALWFLHADTLVPNNADQMIMQALNNRSQNWGRFDVVITGNNRLLTVIAALMNWRSRLSGIATGDQGMFIKRSYFEAVGGFANIPLMEDIALSKNLKRLARPCCLSSTIQTSGRRWESNGIIRTILLMWVLRAAYALGVPPQRLKQFYG
ncbi:MAG: TIGR04283 family arsenosugar biosynthesis glycosyltransferase [Gammaproteobacteria bacterium]